MAEALGFARGTRKRLNKIGLDIAVEDQAQQDVMRVVDKVIRRQTIAIVNGANWSREQADATIEKLNRGDMTDDEARKMVTEVAKS